MTRKTRRLETGVIKPLASGNPPPPSGEIVARFIVTVSARQQDYYSDRESFQKIPTDSAFNLFHQVNFDTEKEAMEYYDMLLTRGAILSKARVAKQLGIAMVLDTGKMEDDMRVFEAVDVGRRKKR